MSRPAIYAPITQCASPEASASFFQMGTSCFRRSMPWRHASNASARWAAEHATTTETSPIASSPARALVRETGNSAGLGAVADGPQEHARAARGRVADEGDRLVRTDRLVRDAAEQVFPHGLLLPTAVGWLGGGAHPPVRRRGGPG